MHGAARRYVAEQIDRHGPFESVIEIGSRDINGTIRDLFSEAVSYTGLDLHDGPGVDWVGDAAQYEPALAVDCVVCCEVLEHAANWRGLIKAGTSWLKSGGCMIITCAGPGRRPHSAIDGRHRLLDGEHYENVKTGELRTALTLAYLLPEVHGRDQDVQGIAWKP